jgi:hypothetical protein
MAIAWLADLVEYQARVVSMDVRGQDEEEMPGSRAHAWTYLRDMYSLWMAGADDDQLALLEETMRDEFGECCSYYCEPHNTSLSDHDADAESVSTKHGVFRLERDVARLRDEREEICGGQV